MRLARAARAGDADALERLAALLRPGLFALAYAELRHFEDAQDAVAAALLRAVRHFGGQREPERVEAWFRAVVRNEVRRLRGRAERPPAAPPGAGQHAAAGPSLARLDVERALRRIPAAQARAVALHYFGGLSVEAVARHLGRPPGTVKFLLHRGRHSLAEHLKEYDAMSDADETTWKAALLCPDLPPPLVRQMTDAMTRAGWERPAILTDFEEAVPEPDAGGGGGPRLPPRLRGCRCLVLDDAAGGGRSAFELMPLLNATRERADLAVLMVAGGDPLPESRVLAAYLSGVDMLLARPFALEEFEAFCARLRRHRAAAG